MVPFINFFASRNNLVLVVHKQKAWKEIGMMLFPMSKFPLDQKAGLLNLFTLIEDRCD